MRSLDAGQKYRARRKKALNTVCHATPPQLRALSGQYGIILWTTGDRLGTADKEMAFRNFLHTVLLMKMLNSFVLIDYAIVYTSN